MSDRKVAIRSSFGTYICMVASGFTAATDSGSGNVSKQSSISPISTFALENNPDGTVSFRSTEYNNCYLRIDGSAANVTPGVVNQGSFYNAQYGKGPHEKYKIVPTATPGKVGLESAAFPGRYMRVGGDDLVNVQGVLGEHETFELVNV